MPTPDCLLDFLAHSRAELRAKAQEHRSYAEVLSVLASDYQRLAKEFEEKAAGNKKMVYLELLPAKRHVHLN